MPTTYTPNASNDPATYTLPSDLDNATAESVNVAFRALADKAAHAYSVFARLATSNTFAGQIKIGTPAATDHALEVLGSGRWRPLLVAHVGFTYLGEEAEVRYYVNDPAAGGGAYFGAIVCNAVYAFSGIWQQQANFLGSTAILFKGTGFDFSYVPPGSADWATWPTGQAEVFAGSVTATSVTSSTAVTAGSLAYSPSLTVTEAIPVGHAFGDVGNDTTKPAAIMPAVGPYKIWVPLRISAGVQPAVLRFSAYQATATQMSFRIREKTTGFIPATTASLTDLAGVIASDGDAGTVFTTDTTAGAFKGGQLNCGACVFDPAKEYFLEWTGSSASDELHGLRWIGNTVSGPSYGTR